MLLRIRPRIKQRSPSCPETADVAKMCICSCTPYFVFQVELEGSDLSASFCTYVEWLQCSTIDCLLLFLAASLGQSAATFCAALGLL